MLTILILSRRHKVHALANNATTTVSHLQFCDFQKCYHVLKTCMAKSQTYERIYPSYHRHKTFVLTLYIHHIIFRPCSLCNCLLVDMTSPTHYNEFLKIWFSLSFFFFFVIATRLRATLLPRVLVRHSPSLFLLWTLAPTRELLWQKYWFYCGLLVQCRSAVNIAKNHSLVYKITFVAFEL